MNYFCVEVLVILKSIITKVNTSQTC